MKFEIDTETKEVIFKGVYTLKEILETMKTLFPVEWDEYTVKQEVITKEVPIWYNSPTHTFTDFKIDYINPPYTTPGTNPYEVIYCTSKQAYALDIANAGSGTHVYLFELRDEGLDRISVLSGELDL